MTTPNPFDTPLSVPQKADDGQAVIRRGRNRGRQLGTEDQSPLSLGALGNFGQDLPAYRGLDDDAAELAATADADADELADEPDPADPGPAESADFHEEDFDERAEAVTSADGDAEDADWREWLGADGQADEGQADEDDYDIPDYDALDAAPAPVLTDRNGRGPGASARRPRRERHLYAPDRGRGIVTALLTVAAVGAVVTTVVIINLDAARDQGSPAPATPPTATLSAAAAGTPAAAVWPHATADCRRTRTAALTTGADPGDTETGPGAILGFEHAYYVARSGEQARTYVAADADVPAAEVIQTGIDAVPHGVRYCVYITAAAAAGGDAWHVQLHEQWPGDPAPERYNQHITTRTAAGRTLITSIKEAQ
jgi:hypothetical protein